MYRNILPMVRLHHTLPCQQRTVPIYSIEVSHRATIIGIAVEHNAPHGKGEFYKIEPKANSFFYDEENVNSFCEA